MLRTLLPAWNDVSRPIVGMLHLPALPGAPLCSLSPRVIRERLLSDAEALVAGGVHGLMMENFGDTPFYPGRVPASVIAQMTELAGHVRRRFKVPLGINVLRNDGRGALAVAHAVGADFIRVNILCGARVTDQGVISGIAHDLLRDRAALGAVEVRIMADVNVKHSAPLGAARPIEEEVADMLKRGGADAVIVSGGGTGQATDVGEVHQVRAAAVNAPVFVGSGVTPDSVGGFLPDCDGFIVGTSLKVDGVSTNAVDPERVRELARAVAGAAG